MGTPRIVMIGAGSGFTVSVAKTLGDEALAKGAFVLVDINAERLEAAEKAVNTIFRDNNISLTVESTTEIDRALDGADYVITSCEINRNPFWLKDIEIPEKHGVVQLKGENGGPGGQIHAMRNICLFMPIVEAMERLCPEAWLLNFTNPMSILCTYLMKYTKVKSAGFCHQVHGSFGVIAEQLGFEPGELQVISAGINHLNWLFDIRRRSTGKSYMKEFLERFPASEWWNKLHKNVPEQRFTLEVYKTFGMYPIGYDDHIVEYMPFFYEQEEWEKLGFETMKQHLQEMSAKKKQSLETTMQSQHLLGEYIDKPPFPANAGDPYYHEDPGKVVRALETNELLYMDANVGFNHGAVSNLPYDAIVDRPAVVIGGQVRSVHVGELPPGPAEICRRQIAIHEMVARAAVEGDASLAVQALCLDPYVRSITQARAIWEDFQKEYAEYLPTFA